MDLNDFFYGSTNQLLKDNRFNIDKDFFDRCLKFRTLKEYRIIKVKLGDIRYGKTPLKDVKPYHYLDGNTEEYEQYCQYHQSVLQIDMNFDRYNKLIESISTYGYNPKNIIIVSDNNELADGQHRACILLHKYGENYEIPVLYIKLNKKTLFRKIQQKISTLFK